MTEQSAEQGSRALTGGAEQITVRRADGSILMERPKSPLELAQDVHGQAQQTAEWVVHPACASPPAHSGVSTYRFTDGMRWCFKCQIAWMP
jgi:hypothetical protein